MTSPVTFLDAAKNSSEGPVSRVAKEIFHMDMKTVPARELVNTALKEALGEKESQ